MLAECNANTAGDAPRRQLGQFSAHGVNLLLTDHSGKPTLESHFSVAQGCNSAHADGL